MYTLNFNDAPSRTSFADYTRDAELYYCAERAADRAAILVQRDTEAERDNNAR